MTLATRLVALGVTLGLITGPWVAPAVAQSPEPPASTSALNNPPPRAAAGAVAAAVAVNVFRVPGKALLCGFGSVVAGSLMLLTFGTQYQGAGAVFREGCGGKWVIGPGDLDRDVDAPQAIFSGGP
jgi:hypothetical protein